MPSERGDAWKQAAKEAILALEAESSAEVVIAVRPHARDFTLGDVLIGTCAAAASTAFLLYSKWVFPLHTFLWAPLLMGGIAGLLSTRLAVTRRLLDLNDVRHKQVQELAQSLFVSLGVSNTQSRTGILFLFCKREGLVEMVCDVGVDREHLEGEKTFAKAESNLARLWRSGAGPRVLAEALSEMAPALAEVLPKGQNDVNELSDEVAL